MAEPPLFVPVRECANMLALRLFRTPAGQRTAVAFTSPARVAKVLGTGQRWVRLSEPALRSMLTDIDVTGIVIDPSGAGSRSTTRAVSPAGSRTRSRTRSKAAA